MPSPRLLLVDDEPDLAIILGRIARRAHLDFVYRPDARSALDTIRELRPELSLLDVNLPGMSGLELLLALRKDESMSDLRLALFCQSGMRKDIAAGWKAGADFLVCKDLLANPEALQQRLIEILAHADGRSPSGSLTCPSSSNEQTTCDWVTALDRALSVSFRRILGDEVFGQLLRRALVHSFGTDAWMVPVPPHLARERIPRSVARKSLSLFFASLADQLWCLLGTSASAPLTNQLQLAHERLIGWTLNRSFRQDG